jgi:hypothetical protein
MGELVRHSQTKGAVTDMLDLKAPASYSGSPRGGCAGSSPARQVKINKRTNTPRTTGLSFQRSANAAHCVSASFSQSPSSKPLPEMLPPQSRPLRPKPRQGSRKAHGAAPFPDPAQQKEAARRRTQGATLQELAHSYNVGISTIRRATRPL